MAESDYERLTRLKAESRESQERRRWHYYECDVPDWLDEHNRQIEIERLQGHLNPPD